MHALVAQADAARAAAPHPPHHRQELGGPREAVVVGDEVTVGAVLRDVATGKHPGQQALAGELLQARGGLSGRGGQHEPGPERHEELEPPRFAGEARSHEPGIGAVPPARHHQRVEARPLGGSRHRDPVVGPRGGVPG